MRDPTRIDSNLEAALEEARQLMRCYVPLGLPAQDEPGPAKAHREAFTFVLGSQDMPESVRDHLLKLLDAEKREKRTFNTANRNIWLALTVERMREFGFEATRSTYVKSDKRERQSGSRIVQTALAQLGIHLKERTIEDAWTDYRDKLPFQAYPVRKK
jgi:hypothetical protein